MHIVLNRSDAIGDLVLTLPMVEKIKTFYPQAKITLIISPRCKELVKIIEHIDDYWIIDPSKSKTANYSYLKNKMSAFLPTHYFHVGGSFIPTLVAFLLRVKVRGGILSKFYSFILLNKGVRQKRSDSNFHESEANLELLTALSLNFNKGDRDKFIPVLKKSFIDNPSFKKSWKFFLDKHFTNNSKAPCILFHPGMTGHSLNWKPGQYVNLLKSIEAKFPGKYNFIVSFTPSDLVYITEFKNELSDFLNDRLYYLDGSVKGLGHYLSVLSEVNLFIGGSTGPTHLANLVGTPQISFYSPIKAQLSSRWGPLVQGEQSKVFSPDVICQEKIKCAGASCQYYECMSKIDLDDVFSQVQGLLNSNMGSL